MRIKRHIIRILILMLIQQMLSSSPVLTPNVEVALAQYQGATFTGPERSLICKGDRDYQTFMSAIISYDGFIEYWKDILVRYNYNTCLYEDVDSLYQRLGKVRKQIREAFYSCADAKTVERLKNTYYELETMLFMLRKYVEVDNGNFIKKEDSEVIDDLRGFYVFNQGFFSEEKINELFTKFKSRYEPRTKIYADCKDASWQMVIDKWNEFKETAGGITPALNEAKESSEKKWAKLSESAKNMGSEFINNFIDFKINGLPALEGLGQIAKELEKNMPSGVTFEQYTAAISQKGVDYDYLRLENEYETQYTILYKNSSDEITGLIDKRLETLDSIIKNSFPFQNQTINCVEDINDQQC